MVRIIGTRNNECAGNYLDIQQIGIGKDMQFLINSNFAQFPVFILFNNCGFGLLSQCLQQVQLIIER